MAPQLSPRALRVLLIVAACTIVGLALWKEHLRPQVCGGGLWSLPGEEASLRNARHDERPPAHADTALLPPMALSLLKANWKRGWGSGRHLENLLRTMHDLDPDTLHTVIDVGAAQYGTDNGDASHGVIAAQLWGPNARVVGFEPGPVPFSHLTNILPGLKASTGADIKFEQLAISERAGTLDWYSSADSVTSDRDLPNIHGLEAHGHKIGSVRALPLDTYAEENGIEHIHFLKVDVEGHEIAALRSADRLLREGRVDVLSFEYGDKWTMQTRAAMYEGKKINVFKDTIEEPALGTLVSFLHERGHDVFYIGQNTLVPISGPFWTPLLQVCLVPDVYGLENGGGLRNNCWLDLIGIRRGWSGASALISEWATF